jgi:6-phosphogluconolactonase (cycloisomerase 2 family)
VYVANYGAAANMAVSQYTVDTDGSLDPMVPPTAPGIVSAPVSGGHCVVVHPSGNYVYVANETSNNISQYSVGMGGLLAPMSSATVPAGMNPRSFAIDPSRSYAYVVNEADGNVSQYMIGPNGSLSPMPSSTVAAGTGPFSIAIKGP